MNLTKREKQALLSLNRGILARVARKLGKTPQSVSAVWHGRAKSVAIEAALAKELSR